MTIHFVFETKAGRVTDFRLPGAVFENRRAYGEFAADRRAYEEAVASYAAAIKPAAIRANVKYKRSLGLSETKKGVRNSAEYLLRVDLLALGYSDADADWHIANPGERESRKYAFGDLEVLLNG